MADQKDEHCKGVVLIKVYGKKEERIKKIGLGMKIG